MVAFPSVDTFDLPVSWVRTPRVTHPSLKTSARSNYHAGALIAERKVRAWEAELPVMTPATRERLLELWAASSFGVEPLDWKVPTRNLVTSPTNLAGGSWTEVGTSVLVGVTQNDSPATAVSAAGAFSSFSLNDNSAGSTEEIFTTIAPTKLDEGGIYTASVYVKNVTSLFSEISLALFPSLAQSVACRINWGTSTTTLHTTGSPIAARKFAQDAGGGWARLGVAMAYQGDTSGLGIELRPAYNGAPSLQGIATFFGPQLEQGSALGAFGSNVTLQVRLVADTVETALESPNNVAARVTLEEFA